MGVEYNQLGEECDSRKASEREEIHMGWDNNFTHGVLVHEEQVESKKQSLKLVQPWRENSRAHWSIFGVFWSWIIEYPGCQA
jgi:hypothetical protein